MKGLVTLLLGLAVGTVATTTDSGVAPAPVPTIESHNLPATALSHIQMDVNSAIQTIKGSDMLPTDEKYHLACRSGGVPTINTSTEDFCKLYVSCEHGSILVPGTADPDDENNHARQMGAMCLSQCVCQGEPQTTSKKSIRTSTVVETMLVSPIPVGSLSTEVAVYTVAETSASTPYFDCPSAQQESNTETSKTAVTVSDTPLDSQPCEKLSTTTLREQKCSTAITGISEDQPRVSSAIIVHETASLTTALSLTETRMDFASASSTETTSTKPKFRTTTVYRNITTTFSTVTRSSQTTEKLNNTIMRRQGYLKPLECLSRDSISAKICASIYECTGGTLSPIQNPNVTKENQEALIMAFEETCKLNCPCGVSVAWEPKSTSVKTTDFANTTTTGGCPFYTQSSNNSVVPAVPVVWLNMASTTPATPSETSVVATENFSTMVSIPFSTTCSRSLSQNTQGVSERLSQTYAAPALATSKGLAVTVTATVSSSHDMPTHTFVRPISTDASGEIFKLWCIFNNASPLGSLYFDNLICDGYDVTWDKNITDQDEPDWDQAFNVCNSCFCYPESQGLPGAKSEAIAQALHVTGVEPAPDPAKTAWPDINRDKDSAIPDFPHPPYPDTDDPLETPVPNRTYPVPEDPISPVTHI